MILTQEQIKERAKKEFPTDRKDIASFIVTMSNKDGYQKGYTDCQTEQQNDAMEFAEWCPIHGWNLEIILEDGKSIGKWCHITGEAKTTAQLYELYKQDKTK